MKLGIIIQARISSQRLPGKVLKPVINDKSILDIVLMRLKRLKTQANIILATGDLIHNRPLEVYANKNNIDFFSGSENDVLTRFIKCASFYNFDHILRVCADNPFLDIGLTDSLLSTYLSTGHDYVSYSINKRPAILTHYGFFTELLTTSALIRADKSTVNESDREHVTQYLYNNPDKFSIKFDEAPAEIINEKNIRLTVDTMTDFMNAASILEKLSTSHSQFDYNYQDVLLAIKKLTPGILNSMQQQIIENSKS